MMSANAVVGAVVDDFVFLGVVEGPDSPERNCTVSSPARKMQPGRLCSAT
jgi:hypothetical protein